MPARAEDNTNTRDVPEIISTVVYADMCIGCGMCIPFCPQQALTIDWSSNGLYQPHARSVDCGTCNKCLQVCPFASGLATGINLPNEDALGQVLGNIPGARHDPNIGHYLGLYAGYAKEFRATGSSGAIATWSLSTLLSEGAIDAAFCVTAAEGELETHFEYRVCESAEEIRRAARTRYYPAKLDRIIDYALSHEGRYALVALPCSIKALRLSQLANPILKERIVFTVGIFCGGLKTRYYTDYLAASAGCNHTNTCKPEYRIKNPDSSADDYAFGCQDTNGNTHTIRMKVLGDMWGTGLFKPNACDYCDDLASELADLSVGDAWIPPYGSSGLGTSILVIRSKEAASLVERGQTHGELSLKPISAALVNASQRGNINHRRKGLAYRLKLANCRGQTVPAKRVEPRHPVNPIFAVVQRLRMRVRKLSHDAWDAQRSHPGTDLFDKIMQKDLSRLQAITAFSHRLGNLIHQLKSRLGRS
jgi:coenzyme F420-reducing hydrogenase beta subunit